MVDKKTQRAAWTFADGKDSNIVMEKGINNLTQDQSLALVHFGKDMTQQWLMVRLQESCPHKRPKQEIQRFGDVSQYEKRFIIPEQQQQQQTPHQQDQQGAQQQQQTEKMKGKAQEKIEGAKSSEEKGKEKTKEPIRRKL